MPDEYNLIHQLNLQSPDSVLQQLAEHAKAHGLSVPATAELARILAKPPSAVADIPWRGKGITSVASTGCPSSLTTLLVPLFLRALGKAVVQIAVPGRPAGGIDAMAQLPSYRVTLSPEDILRVLVDCNYVHCLAGEWVAPLDARLFVVRQAHGAQNVPCLVAASIVSKAIASGADSVVLDLRVAPFGNYGTDLRSARANGQLFHELASEVGIHSTVVLTDATRPYQPYVGRGESLVALHGSLSGSGDWLDRHVRLCWFIARLHASAADAELDMEQVNDVFNSHLAAHGSGRAEFETTVASVTARNTKSILSPYDAVACRPDLRAIRDVLVAAQRAASMQRHRFPDPCGVILHADPTGTVGAGQKVASIRALGAVNDELVDAVQRAICYCDRTGDSEWEYEVLSHA